MQQRSPERADSIAIALYSSSFVKQSLLKSVCVCIELRVTRTLLLLLFGRNRLQQPPHHITQTQRQPFRITQAHEPWLLPCARWMCKACTFCVVCVCKCIEYRFPIVRPRCRHGRHITTSLKCVFVRPYRRAFVQSMW